MRGVASGRDDGAGEACVIEPKMPAMAATVLLLGLFVGGFAAPAAADELDDRTGVEIGVVIAPRADCAAVRPPCRCDAAGTPTLPPGLAKKPTLPPGLAKKSALPPGQDKKLPDHDKKPTPPGWCGPAGTQAAAIADPPPRTRAPAG